MPALHRVALSLLPLAFLACGSGDNDTPIDAPSFIDGMTGDGGIDGALATPPSPVTNLTASDAGGGVIDLAWTNPTDADFGGVIIVRRLGSAVAASPVNGTSYVANDTIGAGDVVVYAGTGTSVADTGQPPGLIHYAAFARDTSNSWSSPAARANALVAVPAQNATLTVTGITGTPVVDVTVQPSNYVLAGTAAYDSGTDTLTVSLSTQSGIARNVFSPKAVVSAVNQGTVTGDGTFATSPYLRLGTSIAVAGQGAGDIVITGVDGTIDPITVTLSIVDHPMAVVFGRYDNDVAYELVDTGTLTSMGTVPCDSLLYDDQTGNHAGRCAYRPGAMTADTRRIFAGNRSLPVVRAIDPVTNTVVGNVALSSGIGAVRMVKLSPDESTLWALLTVRGHSYWGSINGNLAGADEDHVLVRLDPTTLTETGRLVLGTAVTGQTVRLSGLAVSPDGSRVAIAARGAGTVHIVDTATMTEVDTDAVTDGVQPIDASTFSADLKHVVYDATGATLYVQADDGTAVGVIDTASFQLTTVALGGLDDDSGALVRGDDGAIYVSSAPDTAGLSRIDGSAVTEVDTPDRLNAIGVSQGRVYAATNTSTFRVFTTGDLTEVAGSGGSLSIGPGHVILITPF